MLREGGVKFAVIRRGGLGLIASAGETFIAIPAFKVSVVDPTGAGDAFCAGMIYRFLQLSRHKQSNVNSLTKENF